ncbi:MAG: undecaprenyl-diphosphate phosphatase [Candidatus Berkiella sp.]
MSEWLNVILLALTQGLTEFLPVSSSAHLILLPLIMHTPDQGLVFDISLHIGTLLAVLYYFRVKIKWLILGFFKSFKPKTKLGVHSKLAWSLIIGSLPIAIGGVLLHSTIENFARSPLVIGYASILFGLLLYFAERVGSQTRSLRSFTLKNALFIGCMQVMALIPGTSRSGITLTGGLFLGFNRKTAATFSFLLSIPAILMAGTYASTQLINTSINMHWYDFVIGISVSAISAFCCIHLFLKLINKIGLLPFVIYRIILGTVLIFIFRS